MEQRVVIPGFRKIETSVGGEGGTTNYSDLTNKPSINNVPLVGNLSTVDLKLTDSTLTEEGVPAEAKTVGDKLEENSTSLLTLKEQLGNHIVKSDVPENAVFTDTVYDDTDIKEELTKVDNKLTTNLLKPKTPTTIMNGVTFTNNGDGTYTLNGTASENTYFVLSEVLNIDKKLKLVGCPSDGAKFETYMLFTDDGAYDDGNGAICDSVNSFVAIAIYSGFTCNNLVFKPMLTTNLNATYDDFVPYTGSTGKINSDVASLLKRIEALESLTNKTATTAVETE